MGAAPAVNGSSEDTKEEGVVDVEEELDKHEKFKEEKKKGIKPDGVNDTSKKKEKEKTEPTKKVPKRQTIREKPAENEARLTENMPTKRAAPKGGFKAKKKSEDKNRAGAARDIEMQMFGTTYRHFNKKDDEDLFDVICRDTSCKFNERVELFL